MCSVNTGIWRKNAVGNGKPLNFVSVTVYTVLVLTCEPFGMITVCMSAESVIMFKGSKLTLPFVSEQPTCFLRETKIFQLLLNHWQVTVNPLYLAFLHSKCISVRLI